MASVTYSAGIDHVSGALSKPGKSGQHSCEKMLLATHRTAATTSNKCNRIYLRTPVKRTSPLTQREHQIRNRFIGVAAMIQERSHDLSKIVVLARLRSGVGSSAQLIPAADNRPRSTPPYSWGSAFIF